MPTSKTVAIAAPKLEIVEFLLEGTAPLVIHRFSHKTKLEMKQKREDGKPASSRRTREAQLGEDLFNAARYRSPEGWDGVHAGAFRNGMISACRLVGFKMTHAKLSFFVLADGWDAEEPQVPLVRIFGTPVMQEDIAIVANGNPYVTVRAATDWRGEARRGDAGTGTQ